MTTSYDKISKQAHQDMLMFGTGYIEMVERRWYNPLRYICGLQKFRRLNLMHVCIYTGRK